MDNAVEDLVLWRDPAKSGAVLGLTTLLYILFEWRHWSVIGTASTGLAVLVATSFVWAHLAGYLNRPGPPIPHLLREGVSESQVKSLVEQYTPLVNKGLAFAYRVATGQDLVLALQVIAALFVIGKLANILSVLGWIFVVVVLAFTLPKAYEAKKDQVDAAVSKGYNQSRAFYDERVAPQVAKIPRASTATPARTTRSSAAGTASDTPAISPITPIAYQQ